MRVAGFHCAEGRYGEISAVDVSLSHEAVAEKAEILVDDMACALAIVCLVGWLVHLGDFVLRMRICSADVILEIGADHIAVVELDFKTFILGLAKVAGSGCNAEPPGAGEIFGKNVVALLPEEIDVTAEAAVKETEFKTHVVFVGAFPGHTIVGILLLIDAGLAGGAEVVVIGNLAPFLLIKESLLHAGNLIDVVTYLAVACAEFEVVKPVDCRLHEFLLSDAPACRECREETEAFTLLEVL